MLFKTMIASANVQAQIAGKSVSTARLLETQSWPAIPWNQAHKSNQALVFHWCSNEWRRARKELLELLGLGVETAGIPNSMQFPTGHGLPTTPICATWTHQLQPMVSCYWWNHACLLGSSWLTHHQAAPDGLLDWWRASVVRAALRDAYPWVNSDWFSSMLTLW